MRAYDTHIVSSYVYRDTEYEVLVIFIDFIE